MKTSSYRTVERGRRLEIYFDDLNPDAQKMYLEFQGVEDPAELNAELLPICILESSDDDEAIPVTCLCP
jgi:hypothetical protein